MLCLCPFTISVAVAVCQDKDWTVYWRLLFPKVTVKDIRNFEDKYRGSEEETEDLKEVYLDKKGDMDAILENVSREGDRS